MITANYLDLCRTVPHNGSDRRAIVHKYKGGIYAWDGDAWVPKRYWTIPEIAEWINEKPDDVQMLIKMYSKYLTRKKGSVKYDYANLLKIRFMLKLLKHGKLNAYIETGEINSLYDKPSKIHAL